MYTNPQHRGNFQQQATSPPPHLYHPTPQHPIPPMRSPPPNVISPYSAAEQSAYAQIPQQGYAPQQPGAPGQQPGYGGYNAFPAAGQFFGLNDATAQMGFQMGQTAMAQGQQYVEQNLNRWINLGAIRHTFHVSNSYVLNKLLLVVFPWRHHPWTRLVKRGEQGNVEGYKAPRDDINAPDLYIPVMAFVSYIILSAFLAGLQGQFHPQLLASTASTAFAVIIFEFCAVKLGCYLLGISSQSQFLDLIAYSGYKFIGIIATMITRVLASGALTPTYTVFFYTFFANGFFLLRSMKYVLLPDSAGATTAQTVTHGQRSRRIQFLFMVALSQVVFMWLLI
ncbi:Protein transport protein yif1 [Saitoella coloradoensis]